MSYEERARAMSGEDLMEFQVMLADQLRGSEAGQWILSILDDVRAQAVDVLIIGAKESRDLDRARGMIYAVDTLKQRIQEPALALEQLRRVKEEERRLHEPLEDMDAMESMPGMV